MPSSGQMAMMRPAAVVGCSEERDLKSRADTAPVHVLFYNATGAGIQLYKLDSEGKRTAEGAIGESMSSTVLTSVDSPWVVADASGKCLEIVLPGQTHALPHGRGGPGQMVSESIRCRGARRRWLEAKRCCANTSRPWAAANRTTIA